MRFKTTRLAACALSALLVLQPAAAQAQLDTAAVGYSAARIDGKTEVEKAMGRCAAAIIAGALLGAAVNSDNRGQGAVAGGTIGGVLCAAMLAVASKNDKARLRQAQLAALNTGVMHAEDWTTSDNKAASARVTAGDVVEVTAPKTAQVLKCRRVNTQLYVDGQGTDTSDVVCLNGDSWVTLDKLKSIGVRAADVQV